MERKAQVRKIASGKMNPVQIEFYAEKAKRFVMIRRQAHGLPAAEKGMKEPASIG